jgi:carbamoyltransferase
MRYCGISGGLHNAAIAFVEENGDLGFVGESERFSKRKNDPTLHWKLIDMISKKDSVTWYEDPSLRKNHLYVKEYTIQDIETQVNTKVGCMTHHESHAASSYYTRPWSSSEDTVMLNIDGAGEYQSATIFDHNFNLLHEEVIPKSIGGVYAMATKELGYKPLEEEYIVMGMASFGEPFDVDVTNFELLKSIKKENAAATVQKWAEQEILRLAKIARKYGSKLCYAGGVAQNVVANSLVRDLFDDMWIAINPTDGGGALGAAARSYALATGKDKINWIDPYLGFENVSDVNPKRIVDILLKNAMCGVIHGKAEFGPRALGNRSFLANPIYDIKDTVNMVKRREVFRPFAPAILEEFADEYFEGPMNEYMQYVSKAKHDYESVTHVDGTARVQIVRKDCRSIIRPILEEFYERTKVPMLLNTSLNVRGKPICNNRYDGVLFENTYKVKVFG